LEFRAYRWNKSSYRFKLAFLAILLALCGQVLVFLFTYFNVRDTSRELYSTSNQQLYSQYGQRISTYFKDINSISTYLRSNEITDFSRYYWKLRDPELAKAKLAAVNQLIDGMNLADMHVEMVYMLGNNVNQTGFVKSVTKAETPVTAIPAVDDMEKLGFLGLLAKDNGFPVFYEKGEWQERISRLPPDKLDFAIKSGVQAFLISLEGRISVTSYAENVLESIVLGSDVFHQLLSDIEVESIGGLVLDKKGRVVWSNPNRLSDPAFEPASVSNRADEEGSLTLNGQEIQYQTLKLYGFTWVQYSSDQFWGKDHVHFLLRMGGLSLSAMVFSSIAAYWISNRICGPLSGLAFMLDRKGNSLPIRPIPALLQQRTFLRNVPLRKKLFYLYVISSIAPVLTVGALSSAQAYVFTKSMLNESIDAWTPHLVNELHTRQTSYENLISRLTADGAIAAIVNDQRVIGEEDKKTLESKFIKQTEGVGDIAYFVLRGRTGSALYASIYPNNLELFDTNVALDEKYKQAAGNTVWLEGQRDIFNQLSLTLIKRLESPSSDGYAGYIQIVLKLTALHSVYPKTQMEYVIIQNGGEYVAGSVADVGYIEAAKNMVAQGLPSQVKAYRTNEMKIDGRNYLLAARPIPGTSWTVVAYQPTFEIAQTSKSLLERNLGITFLTSILVFLISMLISNLLVRPIERLKLEMERVGQGRIDSRIEYHGSDEIGELIASFNSMVKKINDLLNENIHRQVRERELDRLKTHAELSMLQQQINPHFLYNTLEAINMRALHLGAADVSRMVTALARLFRYAISSATDLVELQQELEHTQNYLTIQEIRFGSRFQVKWDIDPQTKPCKVLKLLLQPIVENAINHGLAEYATSGIVEIIARLEGPYLLIEVVDNGIGMEKEQLEELRSTLREPLSSPATVSPKRSSTGVGLKNVYLRLKFQYGDEADLLILSTPMEGTRVLFKVPVSP
jgi:two-component system sensor histidine kinase YesM